MEKVAPAVVTVIGTIPGQLTIFGPTGDQTTSGTGFFVTENGHLITNNHVVEGAQEVAIILSNGTDIYSDIAVLKADGHVPAVASLGNSDVLKPGDRISLEVVRSNGTMQIEVTLGEAQLS